MENKSANSGSKLLALFEKDVADRKAVTEELRNLLIEVRDGNKLILEKLSEAPAKTARGGSKAQNSVAKDKKQFPKNSLTWFKEAFIKGNGEKMMEFFSEEERKRLDDYRNTEEYKKYKGEAATGQDAKFLWGKIVVTNKDLGKRIMERYSEEKKKFEENNKSPVAKEDDEN
jgi:hypothetical protein